MLDFETAWLAGILEGEAHFGRNGRGIRITVEMTDRDVVSRVREAMGVSTALSTRQRGNTKRTYITRANGAQAAAVMAAVYPYMGDRRKERIEDLIAHHTGQPYQLPLWSL